MKVLIIEDEAVTSLGLKLQLNQWYHNEVQTVASGEKAVELARKDPPEIVLVDIRLAGDMTGLEAARKIRKFCNPAIIITTGFRVTDFKEEIEALDPAARLNKPVAPEEIKNIIDNLDHR